MNPRVLRHRSSLRRSAPSLALTGGEWKAYALSRRLRSLEVGKHFFDGKVVAVGETGIELSTDDGGAVTVKLDR